MSEKTDKKVLYRSHTYDCTDSDPYEIIDTDSDPDSIIANHIADYRLYYPSSSASDESESDCSDSEYQIGDYKMRYSSSGESYGSGYCWSQISYPWEYYYSSEYEEDEEPKRTHDEIWCSLISIDEIELCFNKACLK